MKAEELPKDGSIDAGILLLHAVTPPGTERTLQEIATVCGCHRNNIYYIEKTALRKLRRELEKRGIAI